MQGGAEELKSLQAQLIMGGSSAASLPAPSIPAVPPSPPQKSIEDRPKARPKVLSYDDGIVGKILDSAAYLGGLALGIGIWIAGAYFTLVFLGQMGINLAALSWGQWLIPAVISACELRLWPRSGTLWQRWIVWLVVLMFDVGTSWAGLVAWGAGRHIPIFDGIALPESGWSLRILALVLGLAFAFMPEKIVRWAVPEIRAVWAKH